MSDGAQRRNPAPYRLAVGEGEGQGFRLHLITYSGSPRSVCNCVNGKVASGTVPGAVATGRRRTGRYRSRYRTACRPVYASENRHKTETMSKTNSLAESDAAYDPRNPLIVQSDRSLLLEVHNPLYEAARAAISPFAELEKSPEHIHTYRLTPLSLWNAAATGLSAAAMCAALTRFAKYPVPQNVLADIADLAGRWGRVRLRKQDGELRLESEDAALLAEIARHKSVKPYLGAQLSASAFHVPPQFRGALKQALIAVGWPVEDLAGYVVGEALEIELRADRFILRDYQEDAAETFYFSGSERGGSGVIVLPCGAGKTIVGLTAMALVSQSTLILTTSRTSMRQWRRELLDKTSLQADQIVEYQSDEKQIGPVTLTTYQMLTWRPDKTEDFPHLRLFEERNWGLIIYDEVHMLPAPVFRVTAEVQARRRLGLTATLIREDGLEIPAGFGKSRQTGIDQTHHRPSQGRARAHHRAVSRTVADDRSRIARPAGHGQDAAARARTALRRIPRWELAHAGLVESRQLRPRPARRRSVGAGLRHVRLAAGRGATTGPGVASETRRAARPFLHAGEPRDRRGRFRASSPVVSDRTGLQLSHSG